MAFFFNRYPYTDFHELNLDWIISKIKEIKDSVIAAAGSAEAAADSADAAADSADAAADSADAAADSAEAAAGSAEAAAGSAEAAAESEINAKSYADNIADPVSGIVTTWLNNNITEDPTVVIDTSLTVAGAAADAKATGETTRNASKQYKLLNENVYKDFVLSPQNTVNGWELTGNGASNSNSNARIKKYAVTAGSFLHLKIAKETKGTYQWQNADSVPGNLPNNYLVGEPFSYGIDGVVQVPTGATRLIISESTTNTTNSVSITQDVLNTEFLNSHFIKLESGNFIESGNFMIKQTRASRLRSAQPIPVSCWHSITVPEGYVMWSYGYNENFVTSESSFDSWKQTIFKEDLPDGTAYINIIIKNAANAEADLTELVETIQNGIVVESKEPFDTKALKLAQYKEAYYPFTMRNSGSGWTSRVNLLHITDTHIGQTVSYNNLLESLNVGNNLYYDGIIRAVINTGDNTNGGGSSLTNFLEQYTKNTAAISTSAAPYLMQLGNHDANNGQNVAIADVPTNEDLFQPFQFIFSQSGVHAGDALNKKRYYYYDVTQGGHGVRIIMLDMLDHPDYTGNNTNYYCQWNVVYSQDQIDWLVSILNSTPANYGVIIGNHFPFAPSRNGYSEEYPTLNDGYFVQSATGNVSGGWKMIPEIVDAWQRRTTISKTYYDTVGDQDIVANYNFSSANAGAFFVCYLVGHTHSKNVYRVEEENGVSFNQLMMCEDSSGQNGVALNRVYKHFGTISDNAFSCIAIDFEEMKIYRTSYGVYKKCSDPTVEQTQVFDIIEI